MTRSLRPPLWPDAPLVVSEHDESLLGERSGELREDRNAGDDFVAINRARPRNQHDGRMPQPARRLRHRHRARKREAGRGNDDVGVGRVADWLRPGGDPRKLRSDAAVDSPMEYRDAPAVRDRRS